MQLRIWQQDTVCPIVGDLTLSFSVIVALYGLEDWTKLCLGYRLDASFQMLLSGHLIRHPPEACTAGRNWLSLLTNETKVLQRWQWRNTGSLLRKGLWLFNQEICLLLFRQSPRSSTERMNKIFDFKTNWLTQIFSLAKVFVTSQGHQGYCIKLILNTSGVLISLLKLLANASRICFCVT